MAGGKYLVVDGHSVIFAWEGLRSLHSKDQALARETLARDLQHYQDYTGERVVLVFDGRSHSSGNRGPSTEINIQVVYSNSSQTADDLIERLAFLHASNNDMTVVTADNLERQTVISFGATCIDPSMLRERIDQAARSMASDLSRNRRRL
jgi:uncharacterized protein